VNVVERGNESKAFVFACVPPNGRVRLAGSAYDATITGSYSVQIAATAGTWVVLDVSNTIDFHGSEEVEKVFDARSGASYRFYEASNPQGPGFEDVPSDSASLERLLLNRFGQLALVLSEGGNSRIVGVEPNGRRRVLDSAPSAQLPLAALKLEGHTVEWINAGSARSATLWTPQWDQRQYPQAFALATEPVEPARVGAIDQTVADELGVSGLTLPAVRPDRHVGCRVDTADTAALERYAERLNGAG
jgi:hypothetical protein